MPLSEEELRLLEQMEQALAQEDPKFVSTLRGSNLERAARLRTVAAAVVFVLGVAMLMGGVMWSANDGSSGTLLGVVGFVVMLASATLGLAAWRGRHAPAPPARPAEDQLFDFDDHPHRFDVIEGGRAPRRTKGPRARRPRPPRRSAGSSRSHGTFMQRMEQRWERRRHEGGF